MPDWYVLAHQNVAKQSANDCTTSLTGLKFKIAHKRAGSEKWSATPKTQRKRMIMFLQTVIADLEKQNDSESDVVLTEGTPASSERRKIPARPSFEGVTLRPGRGSSRTSAHFARKLG